VIVDKKRKVGTVVEFDCVHRMRAETPVPKAIRSSESIKKKRCALA
jgi:hypothetical protein